jgi:hypothetical protein
MLKLREAMIHKSRAAFIAVPLDGFSFENLGPEALLPTGLP